MIPGSWTKVLRQVAALSFAFALAVVGSIAHAQLVANYDAGNGASVPDPFNFTSSRWLPISVGYPGAPNLATAIVNDLGRNAWQIDDSSPDFDNPLYSRCLDEAFPGSGICSEGSSANNARTALQEGWRFSTTARYLTDYNTNGIGNMGLSVWLNNKGYFVLLDLLNNDLRATVFNAAGSAAKIPLTTDGTGTNAYHELALAYNPSTGLVSLEFDGVIRGNTFGLNPIGSHPNTIQWGNFGNGEMGKMNFHDVKFQIGEPTLTGDYNGDGVVNAADYTVWRNHLGTNSPAADGDNSGSVNATDYSIWKAAYGDVAPGAGGARLVPEAATIVSCLLIVAATSLYVPRNPSRRRPPLATSPALPRI